MAEHDHQLDALTQVMRCVREAAGSTAPSEPSGHSLEQVERAHIIRTLEASGWRVKGKGNAAERLGLSESTLRYKMRKSGIIRPR